MRLMRASSASTGYALRFRLERNLSHRHTLCHASTMPPPKSPSGEQQHEQLLAECRKLVPPLSFTSHKGSSGKVVVVGGARVSGALKQSAGGAPALCARTQRAHTAATLTAPRKTSSPACPPYDLLSLAALPSLIPFGFSFSCLQNLLLPCGRAATGRQEYTGAPYFAAITSLRVGADLGHVFCTPGAAPVIKGYSPELIVLPFLPGAAPAAAAAEPAGTSGEAGAEAEAAAAARDVDEAMAQIRPWLQRMACVIVGPGLGDDPLVVETAAAVVAAARQANIPLLVDGSGLNFIAKRPELVRGYARCVLTPNIAELGRLGSGVGMQELASGRVTTEWQRHLPEIAKRFEGVTIVSKGPTDLISDGTAVLECSVGSSPRRAGGQGDVLAGATSVFMAWSMKAAGSSGSGGSSGAAPEAASSTALAETTANPMMLSAYAGCTLMRTASGMAFSQCRRSMLAGDVITHIDRAFRSLFERSD